MSPNPDALIAQIQRQVCLNVIAKTMKTVYNDGSLLFAVQDAPTPFAELLIDVNRTDRTHEHGQFPVVAELGSGNRRDAFYFAKNGFYVIAHELSPVARANALLKFRDLGLEERLLQREDFHDVTNYSDQSLDLVHAV